MDENGYMWIIKGPIILTVLVCISIIMYHMVICFAEIQYKTNNVLSH